MKTNANKITAAAFISSWVLSKNGGSVTHETGLKAQEAIKREIKDLFNMIN